MSKHIFVTGGVVYVLVEIVEIPEHPWFVGVQFHPGFKSQPTRAQPLFAGFIGAAVQHHSARAQQTQKMEL